MRRAGLIAAAVTVLAAGVSTAQNARQFHRARLVWRVDDGLRRCAREDEFRREVARRLGASPFEESAVTTVTVTLTALPGGVAEGRVQALVPGADFAEGSPVRGRCADLVALLAGRTAVFLEDDAQPPPPPPAEPVVIPPVVTPPVVTPPVVTPPVVTPPVVTPPVVPLRWRLELGVALQLDAFGVPVLFAPGAAATVRLRRGALSLGAELAAGAPADVAQSADGVTLRAVPMRAVALACGHLGRAGLCALGGLSVTRAALSAPRGNASEAVWFTQAAVGARAEAVLWRSPRANIAAQLDGLWIPAPAALRFPAGDAWTHGWTVSAGLAARFAIP